MMTYGTPKWRPWVLDEAVGRPIVRRAVELGVNFFDTMEALHDMVKSGKVRYIGSSSMWARQFAKAQDTARSRTWTPFVSMRNHYNLVYRGEEREMIPLCRDMGHS